MGFSFYFSLAGGFFIFELALFNIFSKPDDFYTAPPMVFLIISLVILFFGAGKFSLDYLIFKQSNDK